MADMQISFLDGQVTVDSVKEIEDVLQSSSSKNCFYLNHTDREFPYLNVLIKGNIAVLYFFPENGHPGFVSTGNMLSLDQNGSDSFSISKYPGDDIEVPNNALVPRSIATLAAQEFFESGKIPASVKWFEL